MITVRQNGKPRVVTAYGNVVCEFDKDGVAMADEAYTFDLIRLGYEVADAPPIVLDEVKDDTSGKAESKAARSKRSRNSDSD